VGNGLLTGISSTELLVFLPGLLVGLKVDLLQILRQILTQRFG
jgi:hypothetical protein